MTVTFDEFSPTSDFFDFVIGDLTGISIVKCEVERPGKPRHGADMERAKSAATNL